jgi:alkylhydroperoxidase family enzyme
MEAFMTKRCLGSIAAVVVSAVAVLPAQVRPPLPGREQPKPAAARITPLAESEWSPAQRELIAKLTGRGADAALRTLIRLPALAEAVTPYTTYLSEQSTLPADERTLLILRTAWLSGSEFLWGRFGQDIEDAKRRRIAEGAAASGWSETERALLRMADELYRLSSVSDATWNAVSSTHDLLGVIDAVETVNHFTALALLYNSIGVQPDPSAGARFPRVAYRIAAGEREPALRQARVTPNEGTGIAVGRTFARHPRLNAARGARANFINRVSTLQPRHREMLILRTGWNTQSEYEWAQHVGSVGRARDYGLDPVKIAQGPDAAGWDPFEQAILRAADELYRDAVVSDRTWQTLAARFDAPLMMSAVFTASSYRATAMALNAFGVQLEPGDERFPILPGR